MVACVAAVAVVLAPGSDRGRTQTTGMIQDIDKPLAGVEPRPGSRGDPR